MSDSTEPVGLVLPKILTEGMETIAAGHVARYFSREAFEAGNGFTGGRFDTWNSLDTQTSTRDSFTPDDLVAVTFLSVEVKPRAAAQLLDTRASEFSALLQEVDTDRDLVDVEEGLTSDSPPWRLSAALRTLPGVGPTVASKLMARKRPRLIPVFDSVIDAHVLRGRGVLWEPLRLALRADNRALHRRLVAIRELADVGRPVSALRVFDVLAWMEGKRHIKDSS